MPNITVGRIDKVNLSDNLIRVRIDRGTPLGNPICIDKYVSRENAIDAYRDHFNYHVKREFTPISRKIKDLLKILDQGYDIELICWCSPQPCHGDIIKNYLLNNISNS